MDQAIYVRNFICTFSQQGNEIGIQDSLEPKNTAIPGYAGYIPSIKAENICARGYSALAKLSFSQEKLGLSLHGLATTGYNLDRSALIDKSKIATSSKYGKSQIQRAYPGWSVHYLSFRQGGYQLLIRHTETLEIWLIRPIEPLINICKRLNQLQKAVVTQQIMTSLTDKVGSQIQCFVGTIPELNTAIVTTQTIRFIEM